MLASAEYNHLEVWVESDGDRLKEYNCNFLPAVKFHPNTYEAYLELQYEPARQRTYTIHVRNTSPNAWQGHLLANPDIDGALLCTEFIIPPESHNLYSDAWAEDKLQKCGNQVRHEVFAVDPLSIREPSRIEPKQGEMSYERVICDTLVDPSEDAAWGRSVNFLDDLDCTLGKINLMIFRGTVVYPPATHLISTNGPMNTGSAYNGALPLQQISQSVPTFHTIDEDDVDPWIKFVFHYGTREALIAKGIIPSSSAVTSESKQALHTEASYSNILVPASPEPEPYAHRTAKDTSMPMKAIDVAPAVLMPLQAPQVEHDNRSQPSTTKAKSNSRSKTKTKAKVQNSIKKTTESSKVKQKALKTSSASRREKQVSSITDTSTKMTPSITNPLPPSPSFTFTSKKTSTDAVIPKIIARDFWREEQEQRERKRGKDRRREGSSRDRMKDARKGKTRENPIDLTLDD